MANDPEGPQQPAKATEGNQQVTFRSLFALREFRALYASLTINWVGDYLTRAAVTVLVYQQTRSVLLSAISFAIGYLPWILFGPVLSTLGDRYPYRRVMVFCDLSRMTLTGMLLIPGLPTALTLLIVLLSSLGAPPAQAARSALMPLVVGRDRLTLALAVNSTTSQAAQVAGYLIGAAVAVSLSPRVALSLDVCTFALSALLIATGTRPRPPGVAPAQRRHLLRETSEGFRLVFGHPVLRSIAIVVFTTIAFSVVPESLAASWAAEAPDGMSQGLEQGLIMAAGPFGIVVGGLLFSRLVPAERRLRLVPVLAVLTPLVLTPTLLGPPAAVVVALVALSGMAQGAGLPPLNASFALVLPASHRARAFGVMTGGIQASQFIAVLFNGLFSERFRIPLVVGVWSLAGTVLMIAVAAFWPKPEEFSAAEQAVLPPEQARAEPAT
ncbi:MFS transporter [Actinoplanes regularis]|uniref:Predicted arabinose efflux permease, MFS family n=1 Tax=Actinoplanes regularis TaxID=52697 RepID=A0A239BBQ0_9ACTN|nr:MFS transporter [Actinoplanes regularis]GIE87856.1 MFS transporter [Actinoplanes regularis]SNS04594.1 Predicted arabinose efflux permease, MFS family [Actinoplanes regularis]